MEEKAKKATEIVPLKIQIQFIYESFYCYITPVLIVEEFIFDSPKQSLVLSQYSGHRKCDFYTAPHIYVCYFVYVFCVVLMNLKKVC